MHQEAFPEPYRRIYWETKRFFEEKPKLSEQAAGRGHAILYGPPSPVRRPPILFIGYQPGGEDGGEVVDGVGDPWPKENQYIEDKGRLARRLRETFEDKQISKGPDEKAGTYRFLESCMGVNAIFLRSPGQGVYHDEVRSELRERIEGYCRGKLEELVSLLRPECIVVLGFSTMELFGTSDPVEQGEKDRWLVSKGQIGGREVTAVPHPSGAWPYLTTADRERVVAYLRALAARLRRRP